MVHVFRRNKETQTPLRRKAVTKLLGKIVMNQVRQILFFSLRRFACLLITQHQRISRFRKQLHHRGIRHLAAADHFDCRLNPAGAPFVIVDAGAENGGIVQQNIV